MHATKQFSHFVIVLASSIVLAASTAWAQDNAAIEQEQIAILRSDGPAADKAVACKKLAIHGSSAAVADLAELLSDPQLASWARTALEAIPGSAADEALRKAVESLSGSLLVGTINSIGVRRDAGAVDTLTSRLQEDDADVASAAAVALGHIGNSTSAKLLRQALLTARGKTRSAVAEGLVLSAERFLAEGKSAESVELYDEVRQSDVPKQRVIEATRGAILARRQAGIPLLLEQLRSTDKQMFRLALGTAREFPGGDVDKALAAELAQATPDRAALIVTAMADRPKTVVVSAISNAAAQGPKAVRIAAITALGRVGDASSVSSLLASAQESDSDIAQAAKTTLADLPGEKVDRQIAALLPTAEGKQYVLLIELIGQRRIEATPALLKAAEHSDKSVRSAALTALGETVALKNLGVLISQAIAPKYPDDASVAQQSLKTAAVRMPDRDACATELAAALDRAPATTKVLLLEILGDVGGDKALKTLAAAAKGRDPQLQDASSKILGKWASLDGAAVLLDLSKTAPTPLYRNRALKGYIALARRFDMPDEQRVDMCQKAFDLCKDSTEQKLVLDVCKIKPSLETLKFSIKLMQVPELKEDAAQVALFIAQKLGNKPEVKALLVKAGLEGK